MKKVDSIVLSAQLLGVEPLIYRHVEVPLNITFADLHHVLQLSLGWTNAHGHEFIVQKNARPFRLYDTGNTNNEHIGDREQFTEAGLDATDERKTQLRHRIRPRMRFFYHYDFGSDWVHGIRAKSRRSGSGVPRVVEGAMACPPEDTEPGDYGEFVAAWRNTQHPKHALVHSWLARTDRADFHPDAFDIDNTNARLAKFWSDEVGRRRVAGAPLVQLSGDLPQLRYRVTLQNGMVFHGDSAMLFRADPSYFVNVTKMLDNEFDR